VASGIEVRDLAFSYRAQPVFADVGFALAAGTYACLIGPSGSGKSTLLYAIAGLLEPRAGTVAIGGRIVAGAGPPVPTQRRALGMVFQDYALWPHMSALENVAFPLRARGMPEPLPRAERLLARMGLAELARRRPGELSGGQRQRVALARALAAEPALILLDEPLSALDATVRSELRAYLATLSREFGVTALHVTHDAQEAFFLADVVGVMLDGRLAQWDAPSVVYRRPADARIARMTGMASIVELRCERRVDGAAEIRLGGLALRVPAHPELGANVMASLILRPDAIVPGETAGAALWAGVRESRFAGEHYAVELVLDDGTELVASSPIPLEGRVPLAVRSENAWLAPTGGTRS
jgi:ABC-type Fe3+/spermidine/putrescine transport system ATPase subunit